MVKAWSCLVSVLKAGRFAGDRGWRPWRLGPSPPFLPLAGEGLEGRGDPGQWHHRRGCVVKVQPQVGGGNGPWAGGSRQRGDPAERSPMAGRRRHRGGPSVTNVGAVGSPEERMETSAGQAQVAAQAGRVEAEARVMLMGGLLLLTTLRVFLPWWWSVHAFPPFLLQADSWCRRRWLPCLKQ